MLKEQVNCPHCNKKKHKIEFSPTTGIEKLDGVWYPLLRSIGQNDWEESWKAGIAKECKCKRFFFVHGFEKENATLEVVPSLMSDYSVAIFCKNCERAFFDPNLTCPTCGTNY